MLISGAASEALAQKFSLGIRGGINFASFSTKAANDTEAGKQAAESFADDRRALAGTLAGIVTNFRISDNFSFQPEILYSAKGYKREGNIDIAGVPVKYENKTKMTYVEVPLLAKVSFGSEDVKVSMLAGPYVGYLAGGRQTEKLAGQERRREKLNFDFEEGRNEDGLNGEFSKFQRLDAGASIGASLGYITGTGTWMVDVRYNYGLTNIHKYQNAPVNEVEIYNRTFSVSIAWLFHFGQSSLKPAPRPLEDSYIEEGGGTRQPNNQ